MARPSEDELIARHLAPLAGPGALELRDDVALATPQPGHDLVVTKDMLVAGVHFFADDPPDAIARKALRVNLSDLAAKGAAPLGFLLGLALPAEWTEDWLAGLVSGLADDAATFAFPLLGGDTVATPGPMTLSVTAFGEVPAGRMVPRPGVQAGDHLYVSGTIGDAALGLRLRLRHEEDRRWIDALDPDSQRFLLGRYLLPEPRLALRGALRAHARAAMDVSDGLLGDLHKMLRLEHLGTKFTTADVPLSPAARAAIASHAPLLRTALTGGDDYEVLCAVAPEHHAAFELAAQQAGVTVTWFGVAEANDTVTIAGADGISLDLGQGSFQHFT